MVTWDAEEHATREGLKRCRCVDLPLFKQRHLRIGETIRRRNQRRTAAGVKTYAINKQIYKRQCERLMQPVRDVDLIKLEIFGKY